MIASRIHAAFVTGALMMAGGTGLALAAPGDTPAYVGRVYGIHTAANGACPSLDWHIVVGQNNTLSELVASGDMNTVFRVNGAMSAGRTFHLDGKEIGSKRTGAVDGKVRDDGYLVATMTGMSRGSERNGKQLVVKWFSPRDFSGVGGEGAGG